MAVEDKTKKYLDYAGLQHFAGLIKGHFVPQTRTINGQKLDADVKLTAEKVGALASDGTAVAATRLADKRNIGITAGPVQATSVGFDGTGNVELTTTIADGALTQSMVKDLTTDLGKKFNKADYATSWTTELDKVKAKNNGLASLDENGKVPTAQLPSYVDDVLEFANKAAFPGKEEAEASKIYVALDTNKTYRWGGSEYVEISASLAIGTTTGTAYDGKAGADNTAAIAKINGNAETEGSFAYADKALHTTITEEIGVAKQAVTDAIGSKKEQSALTGITVYQNLDAIADRVGMSDEAGLSKRVAANEDKLSKMATDGTVRGIRADLGTPGDAAGTTITSDGTATGSLTAFARIAKNTAAISTINAESGAGSIKQALADAKAYADEKETAIRGADGTADLTLAGINTALTEYKSANDTAVGNKVETSVYDSKMELLDAEDGAIRTAFADADLALKKAIIGGSNNGTIPEGATLSELKSKVDLAAVATDVTEALSNKVNISKIGDGITGTVQAYVDGHKAATAIAADTAKKWAEVRTFTFNRFTSAGVQEVLASVKVDGSADVVVDLALQPLTGEEITKLFNDAEAPAKAPVVTG